MLMDQIRNLRSDADQTLNGPAVSNTWNVTAGDAITVKLLPKNVEIFNFRFKI